MVLGVGVDIESVKRFEESKDNEKFFCKKKHI